MPKLPLERFGGSWIISVDLELSRLGIPRSQKPPGVAKSLAQKPCTGFSGQG